MIMALIIALENIMGDLGATIIEPFTDLLSNWFWVIIYSTLAGGVYLKSEKATPVIAVLLVSIGLMAVVISSPARYLYAIFIGLGAAALIVKLYRRRVS